VGAFVVAIGLACGSGDSSPDDGGADADSDSDSDSDTDDGSDTGTDTASGSDTDTDTDTGSGSETATYDPCLQVASWPGSRDAGLWPFSVDSPWNTPLGDGAAFEAPDGPCTSDLREESIVAWINAAQWSHPVFLAEEDDPEAELYESGAFVATIRAPADAEPSGPSPDVEPWTDAHLHVVDPAREGLDEMWRAFPLDAGFGWDADYHVRTDLRGPGVGEGGVRAYGGSAIGGLIRVGELAGVVRHALAFAQPRSQQRRGFVWPASSEDSGADGTYLGNVPMGQLVAIPPDVDIRDLGLTPGGLAMACALQNYGAYDVDSGGSFSIYAEVAAAPEVEGAAEDVALLRSLLVCVTNNGPESVGGGGVRRAPPAPELE
jgi:hypothetical protein